MNNIRSIPANTSLSFVDPRNPDDEACAPRQQT